jgi:hypothetical protein
MREWYGAFPDCGPLAEDSSAKLKMGQLSVCTVEGVLFFSLWLKFVPDWPAISTFTFKYVYFIFQHFHSLRQIASSW